MILYETINTQRIFGRILVDELYSSEMPASMPLRNASSSEHWQYPSHGTDHFSYPCLAFDDEGDEDEDIGDDDNFDDLDDDFDDDFEDDDFDDDDDFEDAFEDDDFEDAFEDEDFDE
ncbi:MAG: hypothetical protein LBB80_05075 [Treponema sp.]|nr:hypothetical protein [Treponema sp.]